MNTELLLWNTWRQNGLILQLFPMIRDMRGHCSQATVDGQVLLSYYCYWLLGPWDMEAELKCLALSNFLLCNFTSSLCCSHKLLTSRFPSLFIWFLFRTLCKVHFQYHLHHSGLFMICLLGYMVPRTGLKK